MVHRWPRPFAEPRPRFGYSRRHAAAVVVRACAADRGRRHAPAGQWRRAGPGGHRADGRLPRISRGRRRVLLRNHRGGDPAHDRRAARGGSCVPRRCPWPAAHPRRGADDRGDRGSRRRRRRGRRRWGGGHPPALLPAGCGGADRSPRGRSGGLRPAAVLRLRLHPSQRLSPAGGGHHRGPRARAEPGRAEGLRITDGGRGAVSRARPARARRFGAAHRPRPRRRCGGHGQRPRGGVPR